MMTISLPGCLRVKAQFLMLAPSSLATGINEPANLRNLNVAQPLHSDIDAALRIRIVE